MSCTLATRFSIDCHRPGDNVGHKKRASPSDSFAGSASDTDTVGNTRATGPTSVVVDKCRTGTVSESGRSRGGEGEV